jgi:hypothetical protein
MFHDTKYIAAKNTNFNSLCNCVVTQQPSGHIRARADENEIEKNLKQGIKT